MALATTTLREAGEPRSRREAYRCRVERDGDGRIAGIEVVAADLEGCVRRVWVGPSRALALAAPLHELLRAYGVPGRRWASGGEIELDQVGGAHAELLVVATNPLRRADRVAAVPHVVVAMSRAE
ncbi:MAG: hypothetical protein M0Z42_03045, partial [Actinomycetota bacterium]|nr:hypothetical protein [Actinomycetota bacterium]